MSSSEDPKNPERVAAGLKASIRNPHVSGEAKAHAAEQLEKMGPTGEKAESKTAESEGSELTARQLAGYKATLSNVNISDEAKTHAREILTHGGYPEFEEEASRASKEHMNRVIAGYKAALHNPRVSDAAKEHARVFLKDHGVPDV